MKKFLYLLLILSFTIIHSQNILWMKRLDLSQDEYGYCLTKDSSENIIISGAYQNTPGGNCDILILKCDSTGDTIWHRQYDRYPIDFPVDLAIEQNGNIIIASHHSEFSIEIPGLAKFSPDGETLWTRTYSKLAYYIIRGIVLDSFNNILACGASLDSPYTFISKFDTSGNLVWSRFYDWGRNGWQDFCDIVLDTAENIIITGLLGETPDHGDLLVAKFNSNGDSIWTRRFSTGRWITEGISMILDSRGNIIVSGIDTDGSMSYDCVTVKYSATGSILWNRILDFQLLDYNTGVIVDSTGNIFVAGDCGMPERRDYFLVKYSPSGETLWTSFYNGEYDDISGGVTIDRQGNPIISGSSSNGTNYDILTIKYSGSSGILDSTNAHRTGNNSFNIKFSNPINRLSKILLQIKKSNYYKIVLHNTLGEVVEIIYQGHLAKGEYYFPLSLNRTGCYFLRVESENNSVCRKIIFLDQPQHK